LEVKHGGTASIKRSLFITKLVGLAVRANSISSWPATTLSFILASKRGSTAIPMIRETTMPPRSKTTFLDFFTLSRLKSSADFHVVTKSSCKKLNIETTSISAIVLDTESAFV